MAVVVVVVDGGGTVDDTQQEYCHTVVVVKYMAAAAVVDVEEEAEEGVLVAVVALMKKAAKPKRQTLHWDSGDWCARPRILMKTIPVLLLLLMVRLPFQLVVVVLRWTKGGLLWCKGQSDLVVEEEGGKGFCY